MKYMVLSDIHGGALELKSALNFFDFYKCDFLILLGDLLNHGPRNDLPKSYDTKETASILNSYKDRIISVRGNCDSEVDSMMCSFPCNAPYSYIFQSYENKIQKIFLTHGHLHPIDTIEDIEKLGLKRGDIVLSGHTHIAGIFEKESGVININPGSTTIPKGGTKAGFAIINEDNISLYSLDNELVKCYKFTK